MCLLEFYRAYKPLLMRFNGAESLSPFGLKSALRLSTLYMNLVADISASRPASRLGSR